MSLSEYFIRETLIDNSSLQLSTQKLYQAHQKKKGGGGGVFVFKTFLEELDRDEGVISIHISFIHIEEIVLVLFRVTNVYKIATMVSECGG